MATIATTTTAATTPTTAPTIVPVLGPIWPSFCASAGTQKTKLSAIIRTAERHSWVKVILPPCLCNLDCCWMFRPTTKYRFDSQPPGKRQLGQEGYQTNAPQHCA